MAKRNSDKLQKLREYFQNKSKEDKAEYLRNLTPDEQRFFYKQPDLFLFDKQIIPDEVNGNAWMYYLLRCGRSFGKTFAGSAWIAKKIRQGAKVLGLCGPTYDDVAAVMVPAILKWFMPDELEDVPYNHQRHTVRFKNGAIIYCYTSDKEIRGPNLEYLWCDEICVWADGQPEKIKERFEDITRAVRIGKHPQTLITSTPKTHPFFLDFQDKIDAGNKSYVMIQGSMLDNPHLTQTYIDNQIAEYGTGSRGRQELYGDLIRDTLGAFWTHTLIDDTRAPLPAPPNPVQQKNKLPSNAQLMGLEPLPPPPPKDSIHLVRTVIGFDPSGSVNGDECGIIIGSLYSDGHAYVREDASGSYDPAGYANKIAQLYKQYDCSCVCVESNFGGKDSFRYILRSVNALMNIIPVHTSLGKTTRAEHISGLYNQRKVHHTGSFKQLEDQMCSFNVHYSKSPDRLDALGYCLTELFWPQGATTSFSGKNFISR